MSSKVKVTYASRAARTRLQSSPPPTLASSPSSSSTARKRPLEDTVNTLLPVLPPPKKKRANPTPKPARKQKNLVQLHFSIDTTVLRTCPTCSLSYTKGAPDDESLHRAHCARAQRGMEWGKEEEKEKAKAGVMQVQDGIKLKNGKRGRIISFRAYAGGKIGTKLAKLLETVNLALSSPPLTHDILRDSKAYLFLVPSAVSSREKIIGWVIAQRIKTAMAIAPDQPSSDNKNAKSPSTPSVLVQVDTSSSLHCNPAPLPTPVGILRLFVSSTHRRQGVATHLLTAVAETFMHGCPLDPSKGHIAFTQPTGLGLKVMKKWGGSGVRIYQE